MRVLVTGARGLLGTEVSLNLRRHNHDVLEFGREFDVSDPESTARIAVEDFGKLDWVINCAAFTAVDAAESNPQAAYETNTLGPSYLAVACGMANVKLLHVSTDFVFSGTASEPYSEEEMTGPTGVYGKTKLEGEKVLAGNHLSIVIRTSWLFGPNGKCFPRSILNAFDAGKELRVVNDQRGTPTYAPFLARSLCEVINLNPFPGIYHLAGHETVSWFEFAQQVLKVCRDREDVVQPVATSNWPTPAKRPSFSALSSEKLIKLGVKPLPSLEVALEDFCKSYNDPAG